jgi:hypothetical protein
MPQDLHAETRPVTAIDEIYGAALRPYDERFEADRLLADAERTAGLAD